MTPNDENSSKTADDDNSTSAESEIRKNRLIVAACAVFLTALIPVLMFSGQPTKTTPPANTETQTTDKSAAKPTKESVTLASGSSGTSSGSSTSLPIGNDPQTPQLPTLPLENFPGSALFNSPPPFLAGVLVDHVDQKYREGEKLSVRFQAEQDAHLYLLYHQADGSSVLLFPNESQRDNRIPAKTLVTIPPADNSFRFRVSAPFGTEVLQVIASTKPVAQLDTLIQKLNRAPAVSPELIAKLVEHLQQDLSSWSEHRVAISTVSKDGTVPQQKSNRIGLFVGIGKQQNPQAATAHEEFSRSAELLHDVMLKEGKLDRTRTRLVLDDQATKINLEEAFVRWLPSVSRPGDTVFVYFAGQVAQLAAAQSGKPDGKDKALVPYDAPAGLASLMPDEQAARIRQTHILDDAVARWLQELTGRQVVLIMDTCHAGEREEIVSNPAGCFLIDHTARIRDIAQVNTVLVSSALVDEPSLFEGTQNKTMWLTHCLTESLVKRDRAQPLTIRAAFDDSRNRLKQLVAETHPARRQEPVLVDQSQPAAVLAP